MEQSGKGLHRITVKLYQVTGHGKGRGTQVSRWQNSSFGTQEFNTSEYRFIDKDTKAEPTLQPSNYSSYQFPGWARWSNTLPKLTQLRLNVGLSSNTIDISFRKLRRRTRKAPMRLDPNYTSSHWFYGEYIIITPVQAGLCYQPWGERVVSKGTQKKIATLEGSLSTIDECLTHWNKLWLI